jgi:hypothetical protein
MGCFKNERFPRAVIELIHDHSNIRVSYILKTATFGKVLPDQTIGILI